MHTHRTFYSERKSFCSTPGSRFKPEYTAHYDDSGILRLDEVGTLDVYADIQSYHDSVEIHNILRRYYAGETDVLERVQGFYADASDLPDSYVGFLNRLEDAKAFFAGLPPDVREAYNNDFAQFVADFDSSAVYRSIVPDNPVPEVIEPEPEPVKKSSKKKSAEVEDAE